MSKKIDLKSQAFHIKYKEFKPDLIVGQCLELPFIITKGKDNNELIEQVKKYLFYFINAFPDRANESVLKYGKTIEDYNVLENSSNNGWMIKPLQTQ